MSLAQYSKLMTNDQKGHVALCCARRLCIMYIYHTQTGSLKVVRMLSVWDKYITNFLKSFIYDKQAKMKFINCYLSKAINRYNGVYNGIYNSQWLYIFHNNNHTMLKLKFLNIYIHSNDCDVWLNKQKAIAALQILWNSRMKMI